jgi:hypothetical protein
MHRNGRWLRGLPGALGERSWRDDLMAEVLEDHIRLHMLTYRPGPRIPQVISPDV